MEAGFFRHAGASLLFDKLRFTILIITIVNLLFRDSAVCVYISTVQVQNFCAILHQPKSSKSPFSSFKST